MDISRIEVRNYDVIKVASMRYKGKYADCGKYFSQLMKAASKQKTKSPPMLLCHDAEYKQDDADIEVCVPVKDNVSGDGITTKDLPAIKAIACFYTGNYAEISQVYVKLADYAKKNSMEFTPPSREIYVRGPGAIFKGNPDTYVTEVVMQVK